MSERRIVGWCSDCGQPAVLCVAGQQREVQCGCPTPGVPAAFFEVNRAMARGGMVPQHKPDPQAAWWRILFDACVCVLAVILVLWNPSTLVALLAILVVFLLLVAQGHGPGWRS
jgi:hypothetical protein